MLAKIILTVFFITNMVANGMVVYGLVSGKLITGVKVSYEPRKDR